MKFVLHCLSMESSCVSGNSGTMTFDRYVALLAVSYSMAVRPFEEQTLLCFGHTHPPSRQPSESNIIAMIRG